MWAHILREQLAVTEVEFWACVEDGTRPDRGGPAEERPGLPYYLFRQLTEAVGLPAERAAGMSLAAATEEIARYWQQLAADAERSEPPPRS